MSAERLQDEVEQLRAALDFWQGTANDVNAENRRHEAALADRDAENARLIEALRIAKHDVDGLLGAAHDMQGEVAEAVLMQAALADRDATIARLRDELVKEELLHDEQLRRALTATDAEIARLREGQAWQPIETLVADNEVVLVYDARDDAMSTLVAKYVDKADWTHWHSRLLPLPAPPAKEADRG